MSRILLATDAWHPQVNGVVQTLSQLAVHASRFGAEIVFLTPEPFRTVALPTYADIRLAVATPRMIARQIEKVRPDAIHIATEGPVGYWTRHYCRRHQIPFTTSFHTRFAEYAAARVPIPQAWVWAWLRRFHGAARATMAATPALIAELGARGFAHLVLWPRGVDAGRFRPRADADLGLPGPIFLSVGRVAVEKNLEAFLALDLPGTKVVVGDGPARAELSRRYPSAVFLGSQTGEALARIYAAADVFVFPSRTDTYGLVLLEALASGVPVAAFPVTGPVDVIGSAPVGRLDEDLRVACLSALSTPRAACRAFALERSWEASTRAFIEHALGGAAVAPACRTPPADPLRAA